MKEINKHDLLLIIEKENPILVDTRSTDAFIGWLVDGAKERGHIPNAISVSYKWFHHLEKLVLSKSMADFKKKMMDERIKSLFPVNAKIILYDNNKQDHLVVYSYLHEVGYEDISYFNLNNWDEPLEYYPNFQNLVPAVWIKSLLDGEKPEFYDGQGFKIFECSWGVEDIVFLGSHIPTSTQIDSDEFEKAPIWVRRSNEELYQFLEANGISFDETIVLYSNGSDGAEYKLALVLKYLGHKKIKVLNGGFPAWRIMGYPVEKGSVEKKKLKESLADVALPKINSDIFINTEQAKEVLKNPDKCTLVDARTWEEYSAATSGYKHIVEVGRIPGAIWGGSYNDYKNIDDTIRSQKEINTIIEKHGLTLSNKLYYFCGSAGWGAAQIMYYNELFGENNINVYEGGWSEWSSDPANPTEDEMLTEESMKGMSK